MLPNILTILRLLSVPVVLSLAYGKTTGLLALGLGLFLLTSITDWLDGYLARTRKAITTFGIVMDPVADKLLILGMLFVFADPEIGLLPMWLALVNLFRELLMSGIRVIQAARGTIVAAGWRGKLNCCIQVVVVTAGFLCLILESADVHLQGGRRILLHCVIASTAISLGTIERLHSVLR